MIFKHFQLDKLNFNNFNFFLLYGKNEGLQNEVISQYFTKDFSGEINKYDENDILSNDEIIFEELLNKSLFSNEKIIIINRASDKIIKTIEKLVEKNLTDIKIIIKTSVLDKKSKLRNFFEKDKSLISIPFYEDDQRNLYSIINNFIKKNEIKMSRETANLLIDRANGSRESLKVELEKIFNYSISDKNLGFDTVKKLTNLAENFSVNELADQYLSKNRKNVAKILNENNYSDEDCILILRTVLAKSKKLLGIIEKNIEVKDIDKVILNTKPPIFWKDKEKVKNQAKTWDINNLKCKIYEINQIETLVKSNSKNSLNLISDFIINY
tara:strand:+ start:252 stop:1229 length:978 start_codon:yes stop_codon:yes gene_type:complete